MRFRGVVYRAHDPRWAFSALSGAGAARTGGRFNRPGVPALYTALSIETAVKEAQQGFSRKLDPMTLVSYVVDCNGICDLSTQDGRNRANIAPGDIACAWKLHAFRREPVPSWIAADGLIANGYAGMLVPSFAPGADQSDMNLVLWKWSPDPPHRIEVHDPAGRLPKNQSSWT